MGTDIPLLWPQKESLISLQHPRTKKTWAFPLYQSVSQLVSKFPTIYKCEFVHEIPLNNTFLVGFSHILTPGFCCTCSKTLFALEISVMMILFVLADGQAILFKWGNYRMVPPRYQWEFQDPKMEVRKRTIFQAIFCGDIPLHRPEK